MSRISRDDAAALLAHFAADISTPTDDLIGYGPVPNSLGDDFWYCGRCKELGHTRGISKAHTAAGKHQRQHRGAYLFSCCPEVDS